MAREKLPKTKRGDRLTSKHVNTLSSVAERVGNLLGGENLEVIQSGSFLGLRPISPIILLVEIKGRLVEVEGIDFSDLNTSGLYWAKPVYFGKKEEASDDRAGKFPFVDWAIYKSIGDKVIVYDRVPIWGGVIETQFCRFRLEVGKLVWVIYEPSLGVFVPISKCSNPPTWFFQWAASVGKRLVVRNPTLIDGDVSSVGTSLLIDGEVTSLHLGAAVQCFPSPSDSSSVTYYFNLHQSGYIYLSKGKGELSVGYAVSASKEVEEVEVVIGSCSLSLQVVDFVDYWLYGYSGKVGQGFNIEGVVSEVDFWVRNGSKSYYGGLVPFWEEEGNTVGNVVGEWDYYWWKKKKGLKD